MDAIKRSRRHVTEKVNFLASDFTLLKFFHEPGQLSRGVPGVNKEPEIEVVAEVRIQCDDFQSRRE